MDCNAALQRLVDQMQNPTYAFADWLRFRSSIPGSRGVYAIYEEQNLSSPVYVGMACGPRGLRRRLSEHWNLGQNVQGDHLKYYIAVNKLGLLDDMQKLVRDHHLIKEDIQRYLTKCRLHWIALDSEKEVRGLERYARRRLRPFLNPLD